MELHGCDEKKVRFRSFKKTWNTFEQTSDCCPPSVGCNFVLGPWNALGRPANAACWRFRAAQCRKCKQSFFANLPLPSWMFPKIVVPPNHPF